jgi:hypothetical protein
MELAGPSILAGVTLAWCLVSQLITQRQRKCSQGFKVLFLLLKQYENYIFSIHSKLFAIDLCPVLIRSAGGFVWPCVDTWRKGSKV